MNMQSLMAQAKKLQGDIEKISKEIEESEFNYENENILIVATGKYFIKKINIKNEQILSDKEMLEDIIYVGINNVLEQIKNEKDKKLGKYTNGLGGIL